MRKGKFRQDQMLIVGNKLFCRCGICENMVRVDKPILGGLHFCLTQEEIAQRIKQNNEAS